MKRMKIVASATLLSAVFCGNVYSETTGITLLEYCRDDASESKNAFCMGFIAAAAQQKTYQKVLCPPKDASLGQYRIIVNNYLSANPEDLAIPGFALVTVALGQVFKCQNTPTK